MDGGGNCVGELDFKCAYNLQCSSCIMKPVFEILVSLFYVV